jgi:hypothetical protein
MPNGKSGYETEAERKLRRTALIGSERQAAADHTEQEETRNPDAELRLDGEEDTVGSDGLHIGDDSDTLFGTQGKSPGLIKP